MLSSLFVCRESWIINKIWKIILFLTVKTDKIVIIRGKILLLVILFSGVNAFSQHLSHQVLLPAAGVAANGGVNYSQTIGETAVEIISSTDYLLTQGFQQPRLKLLPGNPPQGNGVKAYPNPAVDFVNIELFGETGRIFRISVININGTIVYSEDLSFGERYWHIQEIPVTRLARGLYFIRVVSRDGIINRSFKIEKM
ncbi:MAG: hypothetical protein C0408_07895 [Odoribacter sp.]|nr:hypothetical protein [Odoribacter sp.]